MLSAAPYSLWQNLDRSLLRARAATMSSRVVAPHEEISVEALEAEVRCPMGLLLDAVVLDHLTHVVVVLLLRRWTGR